MNSTSAHGDQGRATTFEHDGRVWHIPPGCMRIARGWRVTAQPGHPEAGRTREFKALKQGDMANYLAAMAWYYGQSSPYAEQRPGFRLVPVNGVSMVVPTGVKRITNGWRSKCPADGVEPGVTRDFSDPAGGPRVSLDRAIAWHEGKELVPRHHDRQPRVHLKRKMPSPVQQQASLHEVTTRPLVTKAEPKQTEGPGRGSGWTIHEEVRLLLLVAGDLPLQEIARVMGRTYRATQQKALRLTNPGWTSLGDAPPERPARAPGEWAPEDDLVLKTWRGLLPVGVIQRLFFSGIGGGPKHGPMAVGMRMKELGLSVSKEEATQLAEYARDVVRHAQVELSHVEHPREPTKKLSTAYPRKTRKKLWTPEEDEILLNNRGLLPLAEIHRRFFHNPDGTESRSYAAIAQRVGALDLSLDRASAARLSKRR